MEAKVKMKKSRSLSVIDKKSDSLQHKGIAVDFLKLVAKGEIKKAYDLYIGKSFRHHNAFFKSDATSLMEAMIQNAKDNPQKSLEIIHVLEDGDMVATHSLIKQNPKDEGAVVVHLFRFKRMRIVELWDIGMPVPEDMENELGMI